MQYGCARSSCAMPSASARLNVMLRQDALISAAFSFDRGAQEGEILGIETAVQIDDARKKVDELLYKLAEDPKVEMLLALL